jgi:glycosyltransferase involved in cell wall biosynthesis
MSNKRGIYLIQEDGCLYSQSGAYQHIKMGITHLSQSFEIITLLKNKSIVIEERISSHQQALGVTNLKKGSTIKGSIKDLLLLLNVIFSIPKLYKAVKEHKPDFIYERASYLNFAGLIVSKLIKTPHFYEANGLQFKSKRKYYNSIFTNIIKLVEKWQYKKSSHTFFVGTYGNYWKLTSNNWTNVENGIERELTSIETSNKIQDGNVHLVFLGSLMSHHRPDILKGALLKLKGKKTHMHLVGSKLDKLHQELLNNGIKVSNHGFIKRNRVSQLISQFHIGIIAGSPEYNSNMKLFDYALAKCCILAADVDVLTSSFKRELFFFNRTVEDMAIKLEYLIENADIRTQYGESIYNKVVSEYTWDLIFNQKIKIINSTINQNLLLSE